MIECAAPEHKVHMCMYAPLARGYKNTKSEIQNQKIQIKNQKI